MLEELIQPLLHPWSATTRWCVRIGSAHSSLAAIESQHPAVLKPRKLLASVGHCYCRLILVTIVSQDMPRQKLQVPTSAKSQRARTLMANFRKKQLGNCEATKQTSQSSHSRNSRRIGPARHSQDFTLTRSWCTCFFCPSLLYSFPPTILYPTVCANVPRLCMLLLYWFCGTGGSCWLGWIYIHIYNIIIYIYIIIYILVLVLPVQKPLLHNMAPTCQALLEPYSPFTKCLGAPGKGSKQRGFNFKSLQSCNLAMLRHAATRCTKNIQKWNHRLRVFLVWDTDTRSEALDAQCLLIVKPLGNSEAKE